MDEPFPINRIAHLFPAPPRALEGDPLLSEFVETAIVFSEGPIEPSPNSDASSPIKFVDRLLDLMVREAADEGVTLIRITLLPDGVGVTFLHGDGRIQERDRPPRRLFRSLVERLKWHCGEQGEFLVDDRTVVAVRFDPSEPCNGVTMAVRRNAPGH